MLFYITCLTSFYLVLTRLTSSELVLPRLYDGNRFFGTFQNANRHVKQRFVHMKLTHSETVELTTNEFRSFVFAYVVFGQQFQYQKVLLWNALSIQDGVRELNSQKAGYSFSVCNEKLVDKRVRELQSTSGGFSL